MLLKRGVLDKIRSSKVSLVFRRWKKPTVRTGGTLRTSIGVLEIIEVSKTETLGISLQDAKRAGYETLTELRADLSRRTDGCVYRIEVRYAGPDPRNKLRDKIPDSDELEVILSKIRRWDAKDDDDPWASKYLRLISSDPGTRAADLAETLGVEKQLFKRRVRRLKELGLTESLKVGYRLSRAGASVVKKLDDS